MDNVKVDSVLVTDRCVLCLLEKGSQTFLKCDCFHADIVCASSVHTDLNINNSSLPAPFRDKEKRG